jgi:acyl-CoA synthetase (AMP-forming)/AMP-acid ligase II
VYFVDRIGDTFRWKSENVATTEVSAVISVFPGVLEANVYGTLVPGHEGRASMAAISLVDDAHFDFAGLAAYLKQKLPSYAVPLFLRVVRTMDVTGTFKQQKVKFRKQGIDVDLIPQDEPLYWLQGTTFVRFGRQELDSIKRGESKL